MSKAKVLLPCKVGVLELAAPLGLGTNCWEDKPDHLPGLEACAKAAVAEGMHIDTAEVYGTSEKAIGQIAKACKSDGQVPVLATKYFPMPWQLNAKKAVTQHLDASLENLQVECVDLYYMHMANTAPRPLEKYAEAFADAVDAGKIRAVGVSNFSADQMRSFAAFLGKRGVPLAALQIELSLVRASPLKSGLLDCCKELGVTVVAWAPLGGSKGRLTSQAFDQMEKGEKVEALSEDSAALLKVVGEVAAEHSCTVEAVALAWVIEKGAVPLIGTRKADHAMAGAKALQLRLTTASIERLDAAALNDDGMYSALLGGNAVSRFIASKIIIPLLQDPLSKSQMSGVQPQPHPSNTQQEGNAAASQSSL